MKRLAFIALPVAGASQLVAACAVPATHISVPTKSMQSALLQARAIGDAAPQNDIPPESVIHIPGPPGAPLLTLAVPTVRLAYVYEWIDREGNKHFGEWVGIPISGFGWTLDTDEALRAKTRSTGATANPAAK